MMLSTVKVSNNSLPPILFNQVKNTLLSREFPWFPARTQSIIKYDTKNIDAKYNYSWEHWAIINGQSNSKFADLISSAVLTSLNTAQINIEKLLRVRIGLHSICHPGFIGINDRGGIHVDSTEPHKVGILYLNTCNGNTDIYNEKYDILSRLSSEEYRDKYLNNKVTLQTSITPEENKLISFDGAYYHTGGFQTDTSIRVIVNFNYT